MGNSINDLMYRYFREFKNNDNKLPVEIGDGSGGILIMGTDGSNPVPIPVRVDAQGRLILASEVNVDVGDITIGTVEQGDGDPSAVPWNVRFTEPQEVTLTGHIRVMSWDDLPDPESVPVGSLATNVSTGYSRQSNGARWEVIL